MPFTPAEIQKAAENKLKLETLHAQRKKFEQTWLDKGEKILEPTDINFPDINGNTLLDYAIIASDVEEVKKLVNNDAVSKNALRLAIKSGNLNLIKFLKLNKSEISLVNLAFLLKESEAKSIAQGISLDMLNKSLEDVPEKKVKTVEQLFTLLHQAALISFDDFSKIKKLDPYKKINWLENKNELDAAGYAPLHYAILSGNSDFAKYLIDKQADIHIRIKETDQSPMQLALILGDFEMVKYLLGHGARLDEVDIKGRSGLILAILSKNSELIDFMLSQKIEYTLKDTYGSTLVHYAAAINNVETIKLILESDLSKPYLQTKNLYDEDPLQVAINQSNDTFIKYLEDNSDILIKKREKNEKVYISQGYILSHLKYYLRLTNQDPNSMPDGGHCNGLESIALTLTDKGKRADFFKILRLMSTWEGDYESLEEDKLVQGIIGDFDSLSQLFRYYADHIILLQQSNLDEKMKLVIPTQLSRIEQYRLMQLTDNQAVHKIMFNSKNKKTTEQLSEYLKIISRIPNAKVEFTRGEHATSLFVFDEHHLAYYEPNQDYEMPPMASPEVLAKFIKDMKYVLQKKYDEKMELQIIVYQPRNLLEKSFKFFKEAELPTERGELSEYVNHSPNKFNPLHISVLVGSMPNIKTILSNKNMTFNLKDANKCTPFELAVLNDKSSIIVEMIEEPFYLRTLSKIKIKNKDGMIFYYLNKRNLNSNERAILLKLILATEDIDHQNSFKIAPIHFLIFNHHYEILLEILQKRENINVNVQTTSGNTPLHLILLNNSVLSKEHIVVIEQLLKKGADLHVKNKAHHSVTDLVGNFNNVEVSDLFLKYSLNREVGLENIQPNISPNISPKKDNTKSIEKNNLEKETSQEKGSARKKLF